MWHNLLVTVVLETGMASHLPLTYLHVSNDLILGKHLVNMYEIGKGINA